MIKPRKWLALLLSALLAGSLLAGCGDGSTPPSTTDDDAPPAAAEGDDDSTDDSGAPASEDDKYGGVLNIALAAVASNIDPIKYTGIYEDQIIRVVADTLVRYSDDMSEILPSLATEWESNDAGDVYTFKLREDAYFQPGTYQDGRQMTAADVKFALERSATESALNRLSMLDSVEIVNDFEVICHLKEPNASFMAALTNGGNVIVPQEEVEGWGDDFGQHLVGTGPFGMKEFVIDQSCEVERHDQYWGPKPYLDGVKFLFISDVNMRANSLRSGEVHIAYDLRGENIQLVRDDANLVTNEVDGMQVNYIYLNQVEGPTADIKVREAMIMATDIDGMVGALYQYDEAARGYLPLPPGSWGYDPTLEDIVPKYDPEAAKALLAEAGYADGFSLDYYTSDNETSVKIATIFQQYMKQNLNIDIEIKTAQWGAFSEMGASGKAPIISMSWTWYPDPYFYLNQMFHSDAIGSLGNGQGFNEPEVDRLLDEAIAVSDQNERAKLYKEALKLIVEQHAQIDFAVMKVVDGMQSNVNGYTSLADKSTVICNPDTNVWLSK